LRRRLIFRDSLSKLDAFPEVSEQLSSSKQTPTNTQNMAPTKKNFSHAEIWDDSALVNSWNDAVEEYKVRGRLQGKAELTSIKRYHSIKARGDDVEEVIKAAENPSTETFVQPPLDNAEYSPRSRGEEMDYEEGELAPDSENLIHDLPAKKSMPEKTVDHDTKSSEEHGQVSISWDP